MGREGAGVAGRHGKLCSFCDEGVMFVFPDTLDVPPSPPSPTPTQPPPPPAFLHPPPLPEFHQFLSVTDPAPDSDGKDQQCFIHRKSSRMDEEEEERKMRREERGGRRGRRGGGMSH